MSRLALASAVVATAEAGTLSLTFSDCGSQHGKVTGMSPTSFSTGTTATITGTGTIDEDVTSAKLTATISALGTQLSSCSGDGTSDIVCQLPLGTGSITVPALPFPLAKGTLNLPVKVTTSAAIPASLASVDIHLTGTDQNGESAICLDAHTSASLEAESTGACTSDEQGKLADPKTVGDQANTCGTSAYNIITGKFDHDKFNGCFTSAMGISTACAECYAATGEYGAKNCKADCLLGWCKSGCLSCTAPAQATLATCTGFTAGTADPCEEELQEEVAVTGTLKLTWSDCGSTHGKVTGMSPTSFSTGTTATITGTGTIDEDVTSAKLSATISALGAQLASCSGDGTSDIVCNLPLNTGSITVPALPFPLAKGTLNLPVKVTTSASIPASLASVDIHLTGTDQNGESAICLDAHTDASSLEAAVTGACTSDEQGKLADPKTVGDQANTCGTSAYNIITGKFDHDKFNGCFTAAMGISTACAECYAATGEYGAKNCKADCLLGWCKSGCLSCTAPAQQTLATCTGFTAGTADPCESQGFLAAVTV